MIQNTEKYTTQAEENLLINQLLQEIQLTPKEQWENLLQIMRTFRQATSTNKYNNNNNNISNVQQQRQEQIKKNQAVIKLLTQWRDDDDEQEQKETWEILKKIS